MIVEVSKSVVILSSAQVDIAENLQTTSRTCRPHSLTVRMIVEESKSVVILSSAQVDTYSREPADH
jgi:hypothetical protein